MRRDDTIPTTCSGAPTPYCLRLRAAALGATADHDARAAELLRHMIRNVQRASYGMVMRFYRELPRRFRQEVGPPPRDRDEDEACPLGI